MEGLGLIKEKVVYVDGRVAKIRDGRLSRGRGG